MSTIVINKRRAQPVSHWWEILLVMGFSLGIVLVDARLKIVGIVLPVAYLFIERRLRSRDWSELGFNFKKTPADLLHNLGWLLLVGIGTQTLVLYGSRFFLPDLFSQTVVHWLGRSPINLASISMGMVVSMLLATLGEEIVFRGLFQKRLTAFLPLWAAIGLSSLVFALMHFTAGPAGVVAFDLAAVMVDSIIFGIIFARTSNVYAAWLAHFMGNMTGVILLATMVK